MSHFTQKKELFNKPIRLTDEEEQNPIDAINEFFEKYNLSEVRQINQQMDHACLSTDTPPFDDPDERAALLSYREDEEIVMEAAYLLWQISQLSPSQEPADITQVNRDKSPLPNSTPSNSPRQDPSSSTQPRLLNDKIRGLNRGIADVQVDVAKLCEILVKAWCQNVSAETEKFISESPQNGSKSRNTLVDLDLLNDTIIKVQGKIGKLCLIALELLSETLPS